MTHASAVGSNGLARVWVVSPVYMSSRPYMKGRRCMHLLQRHRFSKGFTLMTCPCTIFLEVTFVFLV